MLTAEVKINGALIGYIYLVNETPRDGQPSEYRWEYYEPDRCAIKGCGLKHNREDGALTLVVKAIKAIEKVLTAGK